MCGDHNLAVLRAREACASGGYGEILRVVPESHDEITAVLIGLAAEAARVITYIFVQVVLLGDLERGPRLMLNVLKRGHRTWPQQGVGEGGVGLADESFLKLEDLCTRDMNE